MISRTPRLYRHFDSREMARRGRIGAYRLHATRDPTVTTANAQATFLTRFEREVDPDGLLLEEERRRRATLACTAYSARLAMASARARRAKAAGSEQPAPTERER